MNNFHAVKNAMKIIRLPSIKTLLVISISLTGSANTNAIPVAPSVNNITGKFPIELQQKYTFFADSVDARLGYFVAKQAGVYNQPTDGSPRLKVLTAFDASAAFLQHHLRIDGTFDSTGSRTDLSNLYAAARRVGMTLRPAPISDAETFYIADGFITDASGRIQPHCKFQSTTLTNGIAVQIPICSAIDHTGSIRPLQSVYSLNPSAINKFGHTQQQVSFAAKAFTELTPFLSDVLVSGAGWDHFFSGQVRWQINNGNRVEIAKITVRWADLYVELLKYLTSVNHVATPQDAYLLAMKILTDSRLANTVSIQLSPGYSLGPWWNPNTTLMENIANEILRVIESKALIRVGAKVAGTGNSKRFYAINIDHKKVLENPVQTFSLFQRNKTTDIYAQTDLSIQCVVGTIDGDIRWNTADVRCSSVR